MRVNNLNMLVFSFLLGTTVACTKSEKVRPPSAEKAGPETVRISKSDYIKTGRVTWSRFPVSAEFNGRVTVPDKDILSVSSRVSGRLESLNVSVGDRIRAGQNIGTVWSPDLATAAQEYEIAKKEGGDLLQFTLQKLNALGVSPQEALAGKMSFNLRAHVDGVVLEKKISAGSSLNPGDVIMTIGKSGSLQFIGDLAPEQAIKVKPGMPVAFDDLPSLHATVENVSPISDPSTHMVRIRCKFSSKLPDEVPQESFLKSRIAIDEIQGLVVPSSAIVYADGSDVIFIQDEGDKNQNLFRRTKIVVKSKSLDKSAIEIPKANQSTYTIVTDGALLVNDLLEDTGQN